MDEFELKTALNELRADLFKYPLVYALASGLSLTDSLKKANRSKGWFYGLPEEEQTRLVSIASELKASPIIQAKSILDGAVVKAAEVKVAGLESRNENIKQSASSEILDRTVGKVPDELNVKGKVIAQVITGVSYADLQPDREQ